MFTTNDLHTIAHHVAWVEDYSEDAIFQEGGALWYRRYGHRCKCSRRARRRGCWHDWHSAECMTSLRQAIDSGQFGRILDTERTEVDRLMAEYWVEVV